MLCRASIVGGIRVRLRALSLLTLAIALTALVGAADTVVCEPGLGEER